MKSLKELLIGKGKTMLIQYGQDLDRRLKRGLQTLGLNRHQVKIIREIFWMICLSQPVNRWERELKVALMYEAVQKGATLRQTHDALKTAGCEVLIVSNASVYPVEE